MSDIKSDAAFKSDAAPSEHALPLRDGFFSRSNLNAAGWVLIFAMTGYIFGLVDPFNSRLQEVVVKNINSLDRDNSYPPQVVVFDAEAREEIERLRIALSETRSAVHDLAEVTSDDSRRTALDSELQELRSANAAVTRALESVQPASSTSEVPTTSRASVDTGISLVYPLATHRAFNLPAENRGYTLRIPTYLKDLSCPIYDKDEGRLRFDFHIDSSKLKIMSPIVLSVSKINAPLHQTFLFGGRVDAKSGSNIVDLKFNPKPGKYDVSIGYFDLKQLSGEFPYMFGLSCEVVIK